MESPTFAALSKDSLRALTVEAVLTFVRQSAPGCSIHKIACFELPSEQQEPDSGAAASPLTSPIPHPAAAATNALSGAQNKHLLPGAGDSMAQAVLQFLDQLIAHRAAAQSKRSAAEADRAGPLADRSPPIVGDSSTSSSAADTAASHMAAHIVSCNVPLPASFYRSAQAFSAVFG